MKKPLKYLGETKEHLTKPENSPVLTTPRRWSKEEEEWALKCSNEGYSSSEIAIALERSQTSVSIKLKRLKKKTGDYNEKHRDDKYKTNDLFIEMIKPKSVFDVFSGKTSYYTKHSNIKTIVTNDINSEFETTYNLDYLKALYSEYLNDSRYDIVDLDPFGSAYDGFDTAIKMAKKALL